MRRSKIVCTIGPASDHPDMLKKMILAGMNVARLNFSHGTHEEHGRRAAAVRRAAAEVGANVAIMLDTKGPEIRIGHFKDEPVFLTGNATVTLTTDEIEGDSQRIPVTYKGLPGDVKEGDAILIADGLIKLEVLSTTATEVMCRVVNGGKLTSQKGINLPGIKVNLPAVTQKDIQDITFGVEQGFDFIAASFIRRASDVLAIRQVLEELGSNINIISKIESRQAVNNLDEIISVSDGIMVARGDLGVEIPVEEVPLVQKDIIKRCNLLGKPVVTATQMLDSMINNPRPTRAEASDVANAIFDGTDAIMLSGETAAGKYPLESVVMMARIAERAETSLRYEDVLAKKSSPLPQHTVTDAISFATCSSAHYLGAAAIITTTASGHTAKMVAKYRPATPIIAVTPNEDVMRKLALTWGVKPLLTTHKNSTDEMMEVAVEAALRAGLVKGGDLIIFTAGVPAGVQGTTNLLRVHTIAEVLARGVGIGREAVTGTTRVVASASEALQKVQQGDILVAKSTTSEYIPAIQKAAAVITEAGGLTSHAAIVCMEFGIPVVVNVGSATQVIPDGVLVTVDGQRGLIYKGAARVL
ncbi:MAG: pyruvate kinase [Pelotomaculum sp.]